MLSGALNPNSQRRVAELRRSTLDRLIMGEDVISKILIRSPVGKVLKSRFFNPLALMNKATRVSETFEKCEHTSLDRMLMMAFKQNGRAIFDDGL